MRKEFNMMLIVVVCAILGVVCAAITNTLYTQGIISNNAIWSTITLSDFEFIIIFGWIVIGIIMGVTKD